MNTYLFGDQILRSTIDFKQLPLHSGAVIVSAIQVELLKADLSEPGLWQHEWKEPDNTVSLSMALIENGFLLRFPDICDFILDTQHRRISVIPHEVLEHDTIEHLLVDQVLPRLLAHEGHFLLHACAVNVAGRSIIFLGKSGWGKSTLAALFHQAGYPLYSDDCILLRQNNTAWQLFATYPSLRLYEDSIENHFADEFSSSPVSEYSDKHRIDLKTKYEEATPPLHAMYFLSDPEATSDSILITKMTPGATCIELIQRSFQLDLTNPQHSRQLMTSAAALTQSVPAYRLSYPHDFENNARLRAQLIHHIQQ